MQILNQTLKSQVQDLEEQLLIKAKELKKYKKLAKNSKSFVLIENQQK